jgi:hypothetical protein
MESPKIHSPNEEATEMLTHTPTTLLPEHLMNYENKALSLSIKMEPLTKRARNLTDICVLRVVANIPDVANDPIFEQRKSA